MNGAGITSGKVWGQTHKIFDQNNVEIDHIIGRRGFCCSLHHHAHKFNTFYAVSGVWVIEVHRQYGSGTLVDRTVLRCGQTTRVKHGEVHRFICIQPGHCIEIYHTEIEHSDIVRDSIGSSVSDEELVQLENEIKDILELSRPKE